MPGRPKSRLNKKGRRTVAAKRATIRKAKGEAMVDVKTAMLAVTETGCDIIVAPDAAVGDILSWAMRRVHVSMLWAARQADGVPVDEFWVRKVDGHGNVLVEPHKWFQLERALRDEAVRLAARMVDLGLAERMVALEEAKAVMVAQAVRTAAEAAGLSPVQITKLGEELRKGLESGAVQDVA